MCYPRLGRRRGRRPPGGGRVILLTGEGKILVGEVILRERAGPAGLAHGTEDA